MVFRGKRLKKIAVAFVCSLLLTSIVGVSAANMSPELIISTDKDEYASNEEILVEVSLNNGTDNDISDITITSEVPEGLKVANGDVNYNTDIVKVGESVSYRYTLNSVSSETGDEENSGSEENNDTNIKDENQNNQNKDSNTDKKNTDGKSKSIKTGDEDFSYLIIIFLLSFAIILCLSNKKIRKRFFVFVIAGALISTNLLNVAAVNDESNKESISVEKIIFINENVYTIKACCQFKYSKSDDFIPSEDASDYFNENLYGDFGDINHVDFNLETGERYFNNELIIFLNDKINAQSINSLLDMGYGAYIVGRNEYDKSLQIRFNVSYDYKELKELVNIYNNNSLVDEAYLNYALTLENDDYIPNDTEWLNEWDDNIGGLNWGVEAINAPAVWDYKDSMQSVNINVFDTGFNYDHEDLHRIITNLDNVKSDHGTHVAGIIAAEFDNQKGISGIVPTGKLTSLSFKRKSIGTTIENEGYKLIETNSMIYKNSYTKLIVDSSESVAIINMSLWSGEYERVFSASRGNIIAQKSIKSDSKLLEKSLKELLESDYDFIICSSAGNRNNAERFIKRDDAPYGYYLVQNIETDTDNYYAYYDIYGNEHKVNVILNGNIVRGTVDAKWNSIVNCIEDEELKKRIIVVGAAGLNGENYYKASFSNIGDRVDVYAPGVNIYSLWYEENKPDDNAKYDRKDGTSMAAPHVTGTVGLIYSFNKNLSGIQLKELIVNTANTNVSNTDGKKMINALEAYNEMMEKYFSGIFAGGDGSEENPYQVSTPEQLNAVRYNLEAHYIQINDIDLSNFGSWSPIGYIDQLEPDTSSNLFTGVYDGNNYSITGLTINEGSNYATLGLFGFSSGEIKNVNLKNIDIDIDKLHINYPEQSRYKVYVGAVCALNWIVNDYESGIITNCSVDGYINVSNVADCDIGGITGAFGEITNCINYANIKIMANRTNDDRYENNNTVNCGGISGGMQSTIKNCINYGDIDAHSGNFMRCGGISGTDSNNIDYCINYGNISGQTDSYYTYSMFGPANCTVGGIVGHQANGGTAHVINYGDVFGLANSTASCSVGGISGAQGYSGYVGWLGDAYNYGKNIECFIYKKEYDEMIKIHSFAGRIYGSLSGSIDRIVNLNSMDSTVVNGEVLIDDGNFSYGEKGAHGLSLTEEEMNEKTQYILDQLEI